jgi:hypothetical protein
MTRWIKVLAVVAVLAAIVAAVSGGAGAAGTPSGAIAGGGKAGPASTRAVKSASKRASRRAANSRPTVANRSAASRLAAERGALLRNANFKTLAGVRAYLRAIGVNPRGVVIQRGLRNYAGSNCPGGGWTCASTAHAVVQIAGAGGQNRFTCARVHCAVVQIAFARAATNTAKCNKTSGLNLVCSITQNNPSGDNVAIVVERAKQASSVAQPISATASAEIDQQTGGSFNNQACVYQEITETLTPTNGKKSVAINTSLEAHQSVKIFQDAVGGSNTVQNAAAPPATAACVDGPLTQTQTLASRATGTAAITQNQNTANNGANVSLDIEQNQNTPGATGANTAKFNQTNTLTAAASAPLSTGSVSQTQSSLTGGILATVNQHSTGVNTAVANQTETQCEDAHSNGSLTCDTANPDPPGYSLTQTQYGPIRNGGAPGRARPGRSLALVKKGDGISAQTGGNPDSTFTINQTTIQNNDTGNNQTNTVQADCQTSGNCTVTQNTNVNGTTSSNTESGQSVDTQTTCSGSTCTSGGPTTTGTLTSLTNGFSVSNADVKSFGYGGMRGSGTGSIAVTGISGPVLHAFLYWNGPTNSGDPASNATVNFNGNSVTGMNIGTDSDNCWNFQNSQSYRADVTPFVTGNITYSLTNFLKTDADINGVSLIVFYDDGNSGNDRNVVLWNGNDSNVGPGPGYAADNWDETISAVPYPGSGSASLDLVVSDGQSYPDAALVVNGTTIPPGSNYFQGDSTPAGSGGIGNGSLWDMKSFDITALLTSSSTNIHVTSDFANDCLSLVVAAANVPASAPVIP